MSTTPTVLPVNGNKTTASPSIKVEVPKNNLLKRAHAEMSTPSVVTFEQPGLVANIAKFFDSKTFSDLKVKCHGRVFNCHRIVVCSQSKPLAAHLSNGFLESQTGIIELVEDDEDTVERLLKYLYSGDYSITPKVMMTNSTATPTTVLEPGREILAHTSVYITAEKFDLPGLKKLAAEKYRTSFPQSLENSSVIKAAFINSLKLIYTETPENDRDLRDVAVELAYIHSKTLNENPEFEELCRDTADLSYDLYKRGQLSLAQELQKSTKKQRTSVEPPCPGCKRKYTAVLNTSVAAKKKGKYTCCHCETSFS